MDSATQSLILTTARERVRRSELEKFRLIKPKPQSDSKSSVVIQFKEDVSENPLEFE